VWDTKKTCVGASFDVRSKIYTHALSPIASHFLVACATAHPAVRLIDLNSGAAVRDLISPGQVSAAVLSVAWSPIHEHVLASGSSDGVVRIWDVRQASGVVALLDKEDSRGVFDRAHLNNVNGHGLKERGFRLSAKAHEGAVNGLAWTDDGNYIISAGYDRRIRVWDAATGANTMVHFGPTVRNGGDIYSKTMFVSPTGLTPPGEEVLFYPNENEIAMFDLHKGSVVSKLRGIGLQRNGLRAQGSGTLSNQNKVTSLVWRGSGGYDSSSGVVMGGRDTIGALYSGHMDGQIRVWTSGHQGRDDEDEAELDRDRAKEESKKRKAVDDAYRSMMGRQISYR